MPYQEAFFDFFVSPVGQRPLPYIAQEFFDDDDDDDKGFLSKTWFAHYTMGVGGAPNSYWQNYFHLLGVTNVSLPPPDDYDALSLASHDWTYVWLAKLQTGTTLDILNRVRSTTNHEFAHHFGVNVDSCSGHDTNDAWCSMCGTASTIECLMKSPGRNRENGVDRLDTRDLIKGVMTGGSITCGATVINYNAGDGAIRTRDDPQ